MLTYTFVPYLLTKVFKEVIKTYCSIHGTNRARQCNTLKHEVVSVCCASRLVQRIVQDVGLFARMFFTIKK